MREVAVPYSIGVVGHTDRMTMANSLAEQVGGRAHIDDGSLGCMGNHVWVQSALAYEPGWSVVLEDDAVPLNDFHADLEAALWLVENQIPEAKIVSLYMGTGYPRHWQYQMLEALKPDPCFILCPLLLHAVGYAIAPDVQDDLLRWMERKHYPAAAPDEMVSVWLRASGYRVAYTNPSLVDHRDGRVVVGSRPGTFSPGRNRPRKAHNTHQRLAWDDSAVAMTKCLDKG